MMKKLIHSSFKLLFTGILFLIITASVTAQKLPNVQETSLRAPANIKVDGKTTEWNNQLQAYNKAAAIFYTISNDNDKLYLTVKTTDLDIANKIISYGLTFTINGSGKMKDQDGMTVTFPVLDARQFPSQKPPVDLDNEGKYKEPGVPFITALNKDLNSQAKDIKVAGIKGIKDTISIYNPEGIKVAALFDEEKSFIYELSIPFKYLGFSLNEAKPVVYNIKLNGAADDPKSLVGISKVPAANNVRSSLKNITMPGPNDPKGSPIGISKMIAMSHVRSYLRKGLVPVPVDPATFIYTLGGPTGILVTNLVSPTDFWGEYTLAK